jgi:flagellar biosynthesis protein
MTGKITKKPKQKSAVALRYQSDNQVISVKKGEISDASVSGAPPGGAPPGGGPLGGAPTIIAKGFGDLAEEIIALAKQNGVLVHEDPYLSDFLATLDLGQEVPDQLYHVIAELIAFSYVLQGKFPDSWAKIHNKFSKKV